MFSEMLQTSLTIRLFCSLFLMKIFGHVESAWTKTITSSSVHPGPYAPQNAIDGNPRRDPETCWCCAATSSELNPWYELDLGVSRTVHRIHVEGRTGTPNYGQHFQGICIYLKSVHDDISVGKETCITNDAYNVDYLLQEPKPARYVSLILYDVTRVFTICELTVYGECTEGTFGGYCESICHCEGDTCNTTTGECPSGTCLPGYYGTACDKVCTVGSYGPGCRERCGNCFGTDVCNKHDGRCPGQCTSGYTGDTCKQECDYGFYGQVCTDACGQCHNREPCNVVTGHCENGCDTGYQTEPLCKTGCSPGTYGVGCSILCGNCKGGTSVCSITDGVCQEGCVAGYKGATCKIECDDGSYGENCDSNCGNCLNGTGCNKRSGECVIGCSAGYTGDLCADECPFGLYGYGCGSVCRKCASNKTCHHIHGTCLDGCKAGFKGRICVQECDGGFYRPNCALECGNCRYGEPCDNTLGFCKNGCADGYQPDLLCKTAIQDESDVNVYPILAISGWSFGGILLLVAIGSIVLMRIRLIRAIKENVRDEGHLYEVPYTQNNTVDQEHPYGSTTGRRAPGHVYANTGLSRTA